MMSERVAEKLKICMVGASAVGKTSLVERFVTSIFREDYSTTIGVKILTRRIRRGERTFNVVLWDLSGQDEFQSVRSEYLRGAAGYLVVIDGTRRETVDTAISLQQVAGEATRGSPFLMVLNKADLVVSWDVDPRIVQTLESRGWTLVRTSAKTGEGVERAFDLLVDAIADQRGVAWI